jgi:hypothetical protein
MKAFLCALAIMLGTGYWLNQSMPAPEPTERTCVIQYEDDARFWGCYVTGDPAMPAGEVVYQGPENGINAAAKAWKGE